MNIVIYFLFILKMPNQQTIPVKKCYICQNTYPSTDKISMLENIGINTNIAKLRTITCSHDICHTCLLDTKNRSKNCTFYQEYIGVCSDCIWWDIG